MNRIDIAARPLEFSLQQAALSERDRVSAGDDEMIEHSHVYESQRLLERLCQELIRAAGFSNPRRMVVCILCSGWFCGAVGLAL